MAARRIIEYGYPILRKKAKPVGRITQQVRTLIDEMAETLRQAGGLGLAAPQVGESLQIFVADVGDGLVTLINPQIMRREGEQVGLEGCLSLPGLHGDVRRAAKVTVKGRNRAGKPVSIAAEDLFARVLQHEIDHLNGILFIDRVEPDTLHWAIEDSEAEGEMRLEYVTVEQATRLFETRVSAKL